MVLTASALFRSRPMTDSRALHPLHSTNATRFASYAIALVSFRRPQTGETVRNNSGAPKHTNGREASPGHDTSNSREHGAFAPASQDTPTSLIKPSWSETSSPGCGPATGPHPDPLVAVRKDLRSVAEDSDSWAGAVATAPGIESSRPGQRHRLRGWLSRRSASRCEHKSVLCVIPPHCRIPLPREPSATSLRRLIACASSSVVGLRRPGVLNITASCVHTGGFTVTLIAR